MSDYHYVVVRFQLSSEAEMSKLVELVNRLEEVVAMSPDFVSAKLHRNQEGTVLINYATWKSRQAYENFWEKNVVDTELNNQIAAYKPVADQVFALSR